MFLQINEYNLENDDDLKKLPTLIRWFRILMPTIDAVSELTDQMNLEYKKHIDNLKKEKNDEEQKFAKMDKRLKDNNGTLQKQRSSFLTDGRYELFESYIDTFT